MHGANLHFAVLDHADLHRANLRRANVTSVEAINANLDDADLREADLRDDDLDGVQLRDANLSGANLSATDYPFCSNVNDADLSGADLNGADLIGVQLHDSNLSGANLLHADLFAANLKGVVVCHTKMPDGSERNDGCPKAPSPPSSKSPACQSGSDRAKIGGRTGCLRAGPLWARSNARQYRRHGYACVCRKRKYRLIRHLGSRGAPLADSVRSSR
jgi:hypothetical protein